MTEPLRTDSRTPSTEVAETETAFVLAKLGGVLLSTETIQTTVELVTRLAAETLPGTAGAGVTLVDSRGRRSTAASNPFVVEVDALQYAFGSGPCLTAAADQTTVRIDDLGAENRWPQWTAAAARLGVQSMLSVPLVTTGCSLGAIKVYSRDHATYDLPAEQVLELFAQQAATLLANMTALSDARTLTSQLTDVVDTLDAIGQAKGVLMAQGARDDQEAFAMLVASSQRAKVKLPQVARLLIASVRSNNLNRR